MRLGIIAGPVMGASLIFSITIYARYNLNRDRHAEIIAAINAKSVASQDPIEEKLIIST